MTDEEMQTFLALKFNDITHVVDTFRTAIQHPPYRLPYPISNKTIMNGIRVWVEAGAPKHLDIPDHQVEFFLKVKFGSVKNAYDYWLKCGTNLPNFLTEKEEKLVIDYVHKPK